MVKKERLDTTNYFYAPRVDTSVGMATYTYTARETTGARQTRESFTRPSSPPLLLASGRGASVRLEFPVARASPPWRPIRDCITPRRLRRRYFLSRIPGR